MGLAKKTTVEAGVATTPAAAIPVLESNSQAAIDRLKVSIAKAETRAEAALPKAQFKQRDFDSEARGKVRCVMFEAALQSPALAGLQFNSIEEFLVLCAKAADHGVAYTWKE